MEMNKMTTEELQTKHMEMIAKLLEAGSATIDSEGIVHMKRN
jgi:hypothetical protein